MISVNGRKNLATTKDETAILRLPDGEFKDRCNLIRARLEKLKRGVALLVENMPSDEMEFRQISPVVDGFLKYGFIEIFGEINFVTSHFLALAGLNLARRKVKVWHLTEIGVIEESVGHVLSNTLLRYRVRLAHGSLGPDHHLFSRLELLIGAAGDFRQEIYKALDGDFFPNFWSRLESEGFRFNPPKAFPCLFGIWGAFKAVGFSIKQLSIVIFDTFRGISEAMRVGK